MLRMFGDGFTHGEPGVVEPVVAPPVLHRHDGQVGADAPLAVEQPRQLADRQAVADRHRQVADEAVAAGVLRRPFDVEAVDRVRPIEHDDRQLARRRFLHARRRSSPGRCRSARRRPADRRRRRRGRRASRRSAAASRRRANGSCRPVFSSRDDSTVSSASPRMPCSGLNSATSVTPGACASRSIVLAPSRERPVWFVSRPTRLPRSRAKPSAASTSMPASTGSWSATALAERAAAPRVARLPALSPVDGSLALRRRDIARPTAAPRRRPSRPCRAAPSRRPCRRDARGSRGR